MESLGFQLREEAVLDTLTLDVVKSSEIEGEKYDRQEVRSSIARKLGMTNQSSVRSSRNVDGIVEMMLDATRNYDRPLTKERLLSWHAAMFPTGYSGLHKIEVGQYRNGPMEVVSGAMGKEKIHFVAPEGGRVEKEMSLFLDAINEKDSPDWMIDAAIFHLWFITIHPFDDGNGRIARAITDMLLARSDGSPDRFYSMSNQILADRKSYYEVLERTQRGGSDITDWVYWFLDCLESAISASDLTLDEVNRKARFWDSHRTIPLNERQIKVLNKILDGADIKVTNRRWSNMTGVSRDTALRDIKDLVSKGILEREQSGGRSVSYRLKQNAE